MFNHVRVKGYDKNGKKLEIVTTANQDPLLCTYLLWFAHFCFVMTPYFPHLQLTFLLLALISGSMYVNF